MELILLNNGFQGNNLGDSNGQSNNSMLNNGLAVNGSNASTTTPVTVTNGVLPQAVNVVPNGSNVSPVTVTNSTSEVKIDTLNNSESGVSDNLKKVDIAYTPPSKAKIVFLFFAFVVLLLFIIFLPEITTMINLYKSGSYNKVEEKITTGKMTCYLKTNTTNLDKDYNLLFNFKDNKLEKVAATITTKGDPTADEESLDNLFATCKQLSEGLKDKEGIYVSCDYSTGKLIEKQSFDLVNINDNDLNLSFAEAGESYLGYQYGQNMDLVEKNMKASGYTCSREK